MRQVYTLGQWYSASGKTFSDIAQRAGRAVEAGEEDAECKRKDKRNDDDCEPERD